MARDWPSRTDSTVTASRTSTSLSPRATEVAVGAPAGSYYPPVAAALGVRIYKWHDRRVRAVTHLDAPIGLIAEHGPKIAQALSEVLA